MPVEPNQDLLYFSIYFCKKKTSSTCLKERRKTKFLSAVSAWLFDPANECNEQYLLFIDRTVEQWPSVIQDYSDKKQVTGSTIDSAFYLYSAEEVRVENRVPAKSTSHVGKPQLDLTRRSNQVSIAMFGKPFKKIIEPQHDKTNKMTCAPSEHSDQPGHPTSLISVVAVRMKKHWVLNFPLSAPRRLWSDWSDDQADLSLCWAHNPHMSICWFCHVAAQMNQLIEYSDRCVFPWDYFKADIQVLKKHREKSFRLILTDVGRAHSTGYGTL